MHIQKRSPATDLVAYLPSNLAGMVKIPFRNPSGVVTAK
jgi:hypothetical protein